MQDSFNNLPIAKTQSEQLYKRGSDYPGGMVLPEDMNGQHEGEGVSEGQRQKFKDNRVENAAKAMDKGELKEDARDWMADEPSQDDDAGKKA